MRIDIVTIFPEFFSVLDLSLLGKARQSGLIDVRTHDLRDFTHDRHRTVDDTPYGGGAGMVMKPEPWGEALDAIVGDGASDALLIVPSPAGEPFTQSIARELAAEQHLVFACGRYEGIDQRVVDHYAGRMRVRLISLGDYVLNGGEVAVMAMIEAAGRLVPGVVGVGELLEEPERRRDRDCPGSEVDLGHERRDERHHDLAALRLDDQEVLRREVLDVLHLADLLAAAEDGESDELVVVPGVGFGRILFGVLDPEDRLREPLGGGAVVDALEEPDGVAVVPPELAELQGLAVPRRRLGDLERELRSGHEAALGVVGVELELDGALQAVRLRETADPELRSWRVGHVSRRCRRRRRERGGRRRGRSRACGAPSRCGRHGR